MTLRTIGILIALPAMAVWADDPLAISSAVVDYEAHQVTVTGSNFSPAGLPPTLAFARAPLTLVSFTNQSAAASLPADFSPGSYLLAVTNSNNQTGTFSVTVNPAQAPTPVAWDVNQKLRYHAASLFGPWSLAGSAAYAGLLQKLNAPTEWGQTTAAYGERLASTMGCGVIHGVLAFGLDTTLHQDPRYFRAGSGGFWRRTAHAVRGTFLTRTDSGGETVSTWRLGSAYGAAFLSNEWYPERLNTVRLGFLQGSVRVGFDLVSNLASEFWVDVKTKVFHRN
jgi:hypothetical protein